MGYHLEVTFTATEWIKPTLDLWSGKNKIAIWRHHVSSDLSRKSELQKVLSADEQARANRFRFEVDRDRFVVCRAVLRTILGGYLSVEPTSIVFCHNEFGKPSVKQPRGTHSLEFNSSHSREIALFAFTSGTQIGIDVEHINPSFPESEVVETYYTEIERSILRDLSATKRTETFFRFWTQKEAYVKALGKGFSHPFPDVSKMQPADQSAADPPSYELHRYEDWYLATFCPHRDYIATVALEVAPQNIDFFQWDTKAS